MNLPSEKPFRNRAQRRAKKHKHQWALKELYGSVCDVCGVTKAELLMKEVNHES